MSTKSATVPTPYLPLSFFAAGILALGLAALALALDALTPLAILHLVAVGSFATIAMGALYQFVPVVGMLPLRGIPLGFIHLPLAIAGTALLVWGFTQGAFTVVAAGGILHVVGVLLQAGVLAATLREGSPAITARGAALALGGFVATAALGIAIALGAGTPSGGSLIGVHGMFGLGAFFGTLIVAVTFRLLRMFERFSLEPRALWLEIAVAATAILAALLPRLGVPLLAAASLAFAFNLGVVAKHRNPAYQRETLLYALTSGLAGCIAAFAALAGAMAMAVVFALWLFVGTAVVGYLQRIIPFIWWIRRSRLEGTRNIPMLGEMNQTHLGHAILALWAGAGLWYAFAPQSLAALAGWPALLAWGGLIAQIARPFLLPGKTPAT